MSLKRQLYMERGIKRMLATEERGQKFWTGKEFFRNSYQDIQFSLLHFLNYTLKFQCLLIDLRLLIGP